jgi:hypothetical protein
MNVAEELWGRSVDHLVSPLFFACFSVLRELKAECKGSSLTVRRRGGDPCGATRVLGVCGLWGRGAGKGPRWGNLVA